MAPPPPGPGVPTGVPTGRRGARAPAAPVMPPRDYHVAAPVPLRGPGPRPLEPVAPPPQQLVPSGAPKRRARPANAGAGAESPDSVRENAASPASAGKPVIQSAADSERLRQATQLAENTAVEAAAVKAKLEQEEEAERVAWRTRGYREAEEKALQVVKEAQEKQQRLIREAAAAERAERARKAADAADQADASRRSGEQPTVAAVPAEPPSIIVEGAANNNSPTAPKSPGLGAVRSSVTEEHGDFSPSARPRRRRSFPPRNADQSLTVSSVEPEPEPEQQPSRLPQALPFAKEDEELDAEVATTNSVSVRTSASTDSSAKAVDRQVDGLPSGRVAHSIRQGGGRRRDHSPGAWSNGQSGQMAETDETEELVPRASRLSREDLVVSVSAAGDIIEGRQAGGLSGGDTTGAEELTSPLSRIVARRRQKRGSITSTAWELDSARATPEVKSAEEEAKTAEFERKCREMFDLVDEDKSGVIDKSELRELCIKLGRDLKPSELDDAMGEMDVDESGGVEYDEFKPWFKRLLSNDVKASDWKKSVANFYRSTTTLDAASIAQARNYALQAVAKRALRDRAKAQEEQELREVAAKEALRQARRERTQRHEARQYRREIDGEEVDSDAEEEEFAELSGANNDQAEGSGDDGQNLRPVGADQDKEWGANSTIYATENPEYPRRPENEVCVRYIKTGRCKFIDDGRECHFDHPPPTADELRQRRFLQKKGLRVVKAHWGTFTRKGQPVPGLSVDVTHALTAMVIDQGGLQLELPREGKSNLPGFGDPCPELKRELRMEIIRSGGGKRVTKKRFKEEQPVMILTRRTALKRFCKNFCCAACPLLWLLVGAFFTVRWMWGTFQSGCVDADFSECSVDDGTLPVKVESPCIVPYNFSSENIELIEVTLERGDVHVMVEDTGPENLIIISVQHIAKSNKAIIGMSSTATSEDGVIQVVNSWNDSHSEDAEAGPLHALNCFRAHVNITLPPNMAYLRPSLNINITGKPSECGWWNPQGCTEYWPYVRDALSLKEPFIERYGDVLIDSKLWTGLNQGGFQWTTMNIRTNCGKIETNDVETYPGADSNLKFVVEPPPEEPLHHKHEHDGDGADIVVKDTFAHQVHMEMHNGAGTAHASDVQLFATEGMLAKNGELVVNATSTSSAVATRVRLGSVTMLTEAGDATLSVGPAYFQGLYELQAASHAVKAAGNGTLHVPNANSSADGTARGTIGTPASTRPQVATLASSDGGHVELQVDPAIDNEPLRPRPVPGEPYPCAVDPTLPGCKASCAGTSCG